MRVRINVVLDFTQNLLNPCEKGMNHKIKTHSGASELCVQVACLRNAEEKPITHLCAYMHVCETPTECGVADWAWVHVIMFNNWRARSARQLWNIVTRTKALAIINHFVATVHLYNKHVHHSQPHFASPHLWVKHGRGHDESNSAYVQVVPGSSISCKGQDQRYYL